MLKFIENTAYQFRKFIFLNVVMDKFHIEVDKFLNIDCDNTIQLNYAKPDKESIVFDFGRFNGELYTGT